jgi:hypothetical protein
MFTFMAEVLLPKYRKTEDYAELLRAAMEERNKATARLRPDVTMNAMENTGAIDRDSTIPGTVT